MLFQWLLCKNKSYVFQVILWVALSGVLNSAQPSVRAVDDPAFGPMMRLEIPQGRGCCKFLGVIVCVVRGNLRSSPLPPVVSQYDLYVSGSRRHAGAMNVQKKEDKNNGIE